MKTGIDQFMDKLKQNAANLKRVAEILAGRALSESEWNETVAALQEAEDAFGAAIEEKGAAAKHWLSFATIINGLMKLKLN